MLQVILSTIIVLLMIGSITYFIYKHHNCKLTYEMETETPFEKELELQCNDKIIFNKSIG
jgi:hypothetical protein